MRPEYFIDTSIWIPYFRSGDTAFGDLIDELIDENRVHINGIVLAELLTGAKSPADFDRLCSALAGLKFTPGDQRAYHSAGRNGYALRRKGISVPMSDVIIATDCIEHAFVLLASDKHFTVISSHLALKMQSPP